MCFLGENNWNSTSCKLLLLIQFKRTIWATNRLKFNKMCGQILQFQHLLKFCSNLWPWSILLGLVADPGFPVGGSVDLVGGVISRGSYVSKILYVRTKDSGLGGRVPGTPPRSANGCEHKTPHRTCDMMKFFNDRWIWWVHMFLYVLHNMIFPAHWGVVW